MGFLGLDYRQLFWTLSGPLEAAIRVAPSEYYDRGVFDLMEPYFGPDSSLHAVSQTALGPTITSSRSPPKANSSPCTSTSRPYTRG